MNTTLEETKKSLVIRHPEHVNCDDYWHLLLAMTEGGSSMDFYKKYQLFTTAFSKNPYIVSHRVKVAPYHNVMGHLVAMLRAQVMATAASFKNSDSGNRYWMEEFLVKKVAVNGRWTNFMGFLSAACYYTLAQGRCYAVVEVDRQTGMPFVNLLARPALLDWAMQDGEMVFGKIVTSKTYKKKWDDPTIVRFEFSIYQKTEDGLYVGSVIALEKEIPIEETQGSVFPMYGDSMGHSSGTYGQYDYGNYCVSLPIDPAELEDFEIVEVAPPVVMYHKEVDGVIVAPSPIIELEFPPPLWLADQLFDLQRSYFNQTAGVEWALLSTNFAQLIFNNVADPEEINDRFTIAGEGYYLTLPDGVEAQWLERGTEGIQIGQDYAVSLKKEMMDTIAAIATSNAPSALRRSGESKKEDRRNLEILLKTYGKMMKVFATKVLNTASIAADEDPTWEVTGFDAYNVDALLKDIEEYREAEGVINSPTFTTEGQKAIAIKASEAIGVPRSKWGDIVEEIDEGAHILNEQQLDVVKELMVAGLIPSQLGFEVLKEAGALPANFPIDALPAEIGGGDLGAPDETAEPLDLDEEEEEQ